MFIDVHCHLDILEKEGADLERLMKGARKNKVGIIISNSTSPFSMRKIMVYAKKYGEVKVAAGIYPINALKLSDNEIDKEIEFIIKNANEKRGGK